MIENIESKVFWCLAVAALLATVLGLFFDDDSNRRGYDIPSIACIDGVEYITSYKHDKNIFTGHFKPDGSLYKCWEVK